MDRFNPNPNEHRPAKLAWQFSLLGLFVVTTIVAICLALGVHFPRIVIGLLVLGLLQVFVLFSADWLMRSQGGKTVRQVASCVWAILGSALLFAAWGAVGVGNAGSLSPGVSTTLAIVFAAGGVMCWIIARQRWP